jgi:uncharacterized protein YlzI (FlbEa/FlbD family)
MAVTLYDGDLSKLVLEKYRVQNLKVGPCKIKLEIQDSKLIDVLKKDPLLQQEMVSAAGDVVKKEAEEIADKVKAFDRKIGLEFGKTGDMAKLEKERDHFESIYKDWTWQVPAAAELAHKKAWDEYKKTRSALKNFKWKTVGKVGLCVIGVAAGVGVAASAAAGNVAGIVAGAYTSAKMLSKAIQTVRAAAKSAETIYAEVCKDVKDLIDEYNKISKLKTTGKEIAVAAIEIFTTASLNSIKRCETQIPTFRTKLKGVEMEAHKAAGELNGLLDAAEQVEDEIKKSKVEAYIAKSKVELKALEDSVVKAIEEVADLVEKVKKGKEGAKTLEKDIAELKTHVHAKTYSRSVKLLNLVAIGATIWAGMGGPDSIETLVDGADNKADAVVKAVNSLKGVADKLGDLASG